MRILDRDLECCLAPAARNLKFFPGGGDAGIEKLVSDCIWVEAAPEYLLPISEVVPLQLFAYFMALEHGVNVDRPRNLSKAVVEDEHAMAG